MKTETWVAYLTDLYRKTPETPKVATNELAAIITENDIEEARKMKSSKSPGED